MLLHAIALLGQATLSALITFLAFVGLAPTKLGERLLGYHLDRKIAALKHDHSEQIEELRAKLSHLGDRGIRANEREFIAVSAVWENFVEAFVTTLRCAMAYKSHPDFSKLADSDITDFLNSTNLSEQQKGEILGATDRNKTYGNVIDSRDTFDAGKAIFDARALLRKRAIFIPDNLNKEFDDALKILSHAQIQRSMESYYGEHDKLKGVTYLLSNSETLFATILGAVRERLLRE